MTVDPALPLAVAHDHITTALADLDSGKSRVEAAVSLRAALDALAGYKLPPYEPEHARPEPVTVGARRALESIRDMLTDKSVAGLSVAGRAREAALRGLESIEQADQPAQVHASYGLDQPEHDPAWQAGYDAAMATRQALVEDVPDPTIEAMPLPAGGFLLILSGWPGEPDRELHARLREQTGAAGVYVCPFPVFVRQQPW